MAGLSITGQMKVSTLQEGFLKEFGLTLRVYDGREFADPSQTLGQVRKKKGSGKALSVAKNMKVGNLEDKFEEEFGLKVQVAGSDDSYLCKDELTLNAAQQEDEKKLARKERKAARQAEASDDENNSDEDDGDEFDNVLDEMMDEANSGNQMEPIDRISFFNIGQVKEIDESDYFDNLMPGVAVLFGEENNFICLYQTDTQHPKVEKVQKVDAFDDWESIVSLFFVENYNVGEALAHSLIKSADEEDEDGFYEYLENHGGEVVFDNPNDTISEKIEFFMVKQMQEGEFETNGSFISIGSDQVQLTDLSSGDFSENHEVVVFWKTN